MNQAEWEAMSLHQKCDWLLSQLETLQEHVTVLETSKKGEN